MNQLAPPPPHPAAGLHPRLRTAFSFLGYCESVTQGRVRRGVAIAGRDLIAAEIAARNAALDLLRNFMNGEVELVAAPPSPIRATSIAELVRHGEGIDPPTEDGPPAATDR